MKIPATIYLFCLCVISGFFSIQNAEAQNIAIRGIISDEQTGKPLEMANVVLESISGDVERGTATDRNGLCIRKPGMA